MYQAKDNSWTFKPSWLSPNEASNWQENIINKVKWEQPLVTVYSRTFKVPRLTFFMANKGISYIYSGVKHIGNGWPTWFLPLLEKVSNYCEIQFNGCLLNLYRDGNDCMGWHSDNEKELDPHKSIASLSMGSSRDFIFKNRLGDVKKKIYIGHGDLLVMHPGCQKLWNHSLPKRRMVKENRINLTFRSYI